MEHAAAFRVVMKAFALTVARPCTLLQSLYPESQNAVSYKDYDQRVPMEIQEQNFEILKEKYGLERNDETMKIRYCNNCEEM